MDSSATRPVAGWPPGLTRHACLLAALLPLLMPAAWALRRVPGLETLFAWLPVLVLFGLLPVLDVLLGRDPSDPPDSFDSSDLSADADRTPPLPYPDVAVPVLAAAAYLGVFAWAILVVGREGAGWSAATLLGWTISLGDIGGVVAINVAHELIHRRARWQRGLGGVLLSCVCYGGFKLEHPLWHHVNVATPKDPSSAPRGSTIYARVPRALWLNTVHAWQLARRIAKNRGRRWPWLHNELAAWWALSAVLAAGAGAAAGWLGVAVFLGQALFAVSLLEIINYIEHYGLRRRKLAGGGYERPTAAHAWNADFWLSNAILLQLQRHPDHHLNPGRPFTRLRSVSEAPQLPLGYAALSIIALAPPLWRRVMDSRLPSDV